jgi:conjugal transfer pilus assembly protein TraE
MIKDKWIKDWKSALAENFFLRVLCLLMAVGLIMNATFFKKKEKIIFSPPRVEREFWVEDDKASPEYLEQMAVTLSTLGGNLAPKSAHYNVGVLASYFAPGHGPEMKTELATQADYVKKSNLTQSFYPLDVKADEEKNEAIVEGDMIRYVGTQRVAQEKMVFKMKFLVKNYKLYIDELYVDYPDRKKQELIKKGELIPDGTLPVKP